MLPQDILAFLSCWVYRITEFAPIRLQDTSSLRLHRVQSVNIVLSCPALCHQCSAPSAGLERFPFVTLLLSRCCCHFVRRVMTFVRCHQVEVAFDSMATQQATPDGEIVTISPTLWRGQSPPFRLHVSVCTRWPCALLDVLGQRLKLGLHWCRAKAHPLSCAGCLVSPAPMQQSPWSRAIAHCAI